ncbi:hypothetical protein ACIQYL_20245 [Lysinibacillus xylanilyticus]|uniref:hypothetical protein n=1 Tax=Lysinibacillus xylanilyticus TaxID=582475 RepID=UPI0037F63E08
MNPDVHQSKESKLRSDPGLQAYCPECDWDGACWINISTGTAIKNAEQERDTHNKNTIHDSGEDPAYVRDCIGGLPDDDEDNDYYRD